MDNHVVWDGWFSPVEEEVVVHWFNLTHICKSVYCTDGALNYLVLFDLFANKSIIYLINLWFVYPDLFISMWVQSAVFSSISVLFNESQACGILIQFYVVQFERFNVSHICYSYPDLLLYSMWAMSVVFLPRSMLFIVSQVLIIVKQISVVHCEPGPYYCKTDLCCSMWARSSLL
jgi:hypothetical protein